MTNSMWRRSVLAFGLALSLSVPVFAQTVAREQAAVAADNSDLQEVLVTGSRIARKEVEGPSPVTIVTGEELKNQGFTTVYEVMNNLTQSFTAQTPPSWGSTNVNARQLNLYNLGPNHSLLLIDGLRVADYPQAQQCCFGAQDTFQNYNNIPAGMVDRIEVLPSGASAIYGSDAVAGVVNIILKHDYQGDNFIARAGASVRGGRDLNDFEWNGGKSGDSWHLVYNFQAFQRSALWGYQRPYTDSDADAGRGTYSANDLLYGIQPRLELGLTLTGQNGNIAPPAGACASFRGEFRLQNSPSGYFCSQDYNDLQEWVLTPGRKDLNGYLYFDHDLAGSVKAFATLGVWRTTGWSNTELPFLYPSGPYTGTIPGNPNPFYDQTTGQVITGYFRQLTAAEMGGKGNTYDYEQNWDFKVGLKGTLADRFKWDVTFGRALYWVHEDYTALNETAMFNFFFGPNLGSTCVTGTTATTGACPAGSAGTTYPTYALNSARFWGPFTPADYSTFATFGENRATSWVNQGQATITGDLFNDWAGPVAFAGIAELAAQGFQEYPDARGLTTSFQDPFQEYNTGGGRRTRGAVGAEFRVPLASTLTATLAGRSDKYNDHSNANKANTWGAGLEWRPTQPLLVRGSYNTSFHAPDMIDVYPQASVQAVGQYNDPLECIQHNQFNCPSTVHTTFFNVYSGANPSLSPEKGKSFTYGLAWDPGTAEGFAGSVDYVHIVLDNQIVVQTNGQILSDEAGCLTGLNLDGTPYTAHQPGSTYCQEVIAAVVRQPNTGQCNVPGTFVPTTCIVSVTAGAINEATTKVSAVNAQADYRWLAGGWGKFRFHLNYTLNLSYQQQIVATDPLTNTSYNNPKSRINASLTWDRGPWEATLWGQRIGGVNLNGYGSCANAQGTYATPPGWPPTCPAGQAPFLGHSSPWITMNISGSYKLTDRAKLSAYVSNVFNRVGQIPYYAGGFEYIQTNSGADYVGREWSLEFDYKID